MVAPTSATLDRVLQLACEQSGLRLVSPDMAIDQDIGMSGDDIDEFASALAREFGDQVLIWPWQRFAELSEPSLLMIPRLFWQLITWPIRGRFLPPSKFERLELGHIARAIDAGHWIEP